jgi:hypothetical protein
MSHELPNPTGSLETIVVRCAVCEAVKWLFTFACVAALVFIVGTWISNINVLANRAAADRALAEELGRAAGRCAAPMRPGDRQVVVIRHTGGGLAIECRPVTNPLEPERAVP